jgi:hypothetical protein
LTLDGQSIVLNLNAGGTVVTGSSGTTDYFTLTLDPTTGDIDFTQLANIAQALNPDSDDVASLDLVAGVLQVERTLEDGDGDQVVETVDLGDNLFKIEDDGPVKPI